MKKFKRDIASKYCAHQLIKTKISNFIVLPGDTLACFISQPCLWMRDRTQLFVGCIFSKNPLSSASD